MHNDEYGDDSEIVEDVDEEIVEDNSLIINKSFDDEFEAVETTFTKRIPSSYNQDVPFELEETETNVQPSNGQIATQEELGFEIDEIFSTMRQDKDTEQEAPIYELTKDEEELLKVRAELDNPDEPYNPILELSKYQKPGLELLDSYDCLLYTSPSPRDRTRSRMPSSA